MSLDLEGPLILYLIRTNDWHGSPWHLLLDTRETDGGGDWSGSFIECVRQWTAASHSRAR